MLRALRPLSLRREALGQGGLCAPFRGANKKAVDQKSTALGVGLVPRRGLEPPRCYSLVPETSASTNSAIWASQEASDYRSTGAHLRANQRECAKISERCHAGQKKADDLRSSAFSGFCLFKMVPRRGLEPPRCYSLVPETSASTNSAIWASQESKDCILKK